MVRFEDPHGGDDDGDGDGSGGGGGSGDSGDDLGDDEGHSVWKPMGAASRPRKPAQENSRSSPGVKF